MVMVGTAIDRLIDKLEKMRDEARAEQIFLESINSPKAIIFRTIRKTYQKAIDTAREEM